MDAYTVTHPSVGHLARTYIYQFPAHSRYKSRQPARSDGKRERVCVCERERERERERESEREIECVRMCVVSQKERDREIERESQNNVRTARLADDHNDDMRYFLL